MGDTTDAAQSSASKGVDPTPSEHVVHAPNKLGLETRMEFRQVATAVVDRIPTGAGQLVVDCSLLESVDSTGVNALIILRRRASARRVPVVLRNLNEEILRLLVLTKLDDLFELEDGRAR